MPINKINLANNRFSKFFLNDKISNTIPNIKNPQMVANNINNSNIASIEVKPDVKINVIIFKL